MFDQPKLFELVEWLVADHSQPLGCILAVENILDNQVEAERIAVVVREVVGRLDCVPVGSQVLGFVLDILVDILLAHTLVGLF